MNAMRDWARAWHASHPTHARWTAVAVALSLYAAMLVILCVAAPARAAEPELRGDLPAAATRFRAELTRQAHAQWGLDAPIAAFAGQLHQESMWRPDAVSRVGAQGLAQFMPSTAQWWCELHGLSPADCQPRNPKWALRALVGYDRWLWQRIGDTADECDRFAMTLSAYNGGLGWVRRDRALASSKGLDSRRYWGAVETVNAGRAAWAIKENREYPRRILLQHAPRYAGAGWGRTVCAPTSTGE